MNGYDVVDEALNPRGEKRPQDGRGHGKCRRGNRQNLNKGKCTNPDKGPGYGQGQGRGQGNYRK